MMRKVLGVVAIRQLVLMVCALFAGWAVFSPTPARAWWVAPRVVVGAPYYYAPRYYAAPPVAVYAPPPYYYGPRHERVWVPGYWHGGRWVGPHWR